MRNKAKRAKNKSTEIQREMRRNIKIIARLKKKYRKQSKENVSLPAVEESLGRENQYGTETLGNELLVV